MYGGALLAVLSVGACSAPADEPAPAAPSASQPRSPDAVFEDLMDTNAAGWRTEFAVEGATEQDAATLAILAAQTACSQLDTRPVQDVLLTLLSGSLPADTAGSLLYAATVAYCPTHTQAVQEYADANR